MWSAIWSFIFDSKMIKTTAASAIGSGAVVIGLMDAKIQEVKTIAEKDKQFIFEYVDTRHNKAIDKIGQLIDTQKEIKHELEKIDDRLYNINKKLKE